MRKTTPSAPVQKSPRKIRVLIADDHVTVREGLAAMIGRQPDMTLAAEAADGENAVAAWEQHQPDVTLLDLSMPGLDGVEATTQIRQRARFARVILLTTFDTDHVVCRAVRAGVRGFLLKDAPREELLGCIRRVHRGETCIAPALIAKLVNGEEAIPLTEREQTVLELLAQGRCNKEIGADIDISELTVKSHLRSLFQKLNVRSRTEAIAVASRRGLIRL